MSDTESFDKKQKKLMNFLANAEEAQAKDNLEFALEYARNWGDSDNSNKLDRAAKINVAAGKYAVINYEIIWMLKVLKEAPGVMNLKWKREQQGGTLIKAVPDTVAQVSVAPADMAHGHQSRPTEAS